MRFLVIITALIGAACAQAKLAPGAPCKQDGSIGICSSGLCVQTPSQAQGVCK
ncbi:hypothetical protein BDW59DRAFT_140878 [Aspergillus cavernicola]|uniref:Uncharacterized protein n=1 Tax=Aspergillus cavernicola TaxID=176166 RepID=A0ABR4ISU0_9EURO